MSLFNTNVPSFFATSEEKLFKKYLASPNINYYILFDQYTRLVGCGGYEYEIESKQMTLTWGMIDSRFHNNGYGRYLTDYRIEKIRTEYPELNIVLNTSQHTFKFYQKFGFRITKITKDYYWLGLDRYDMIKVPPQINTEVLVGPAGLEPATP